ncbi:uncharacterized protein LOC124879781 isoform X2 [Girardinichthys multiradiatus]|uniref:uncharacterized protein LOC124879781 isoform X1 n=1 Tax=Girardinichthys multiradiatus TaxID=208333 RepID=UPI001FAC1A8A|nr:uncharacterized protein LOC124879781 isoform X1 [Girardinichthys multiradiatus]XP_047240464.1 uncharacterized protein LOC124879781 isoform X2 [Girardinichthys multiradiatus]
MDMELTREELYLIKQQGFRTNAFKIIEKMVDWCNKTVGSKHLVDEILHSIFFLGTINKVPFSPKEIIPDEDMFIQLKDKYSRPFECYETQLPRRSPFSCVLDMIVLQTGPENENQIIQTLRDLVIILKPGFLVSSTICVSESNKSSKQYGVSMSTTGPNAGRIVIAASCLSSYWDEYVADAVMTYYPEKTMKDYFDGTIKLPKDVTCRAYSIKSGSEMEPCKSCGNLFGLHTTCQKEWPYGNCAEVESLSNLFEKEKEVKEQSKPTSNTYTPENRKKVRNYTLQELRNTLKTIKFNTWSSEFYRASI